MRKQTWKQILWFIGLWVAGVLCISIIGLAIRAVLMPDAV